MTLGVWCEFPWHLANPPPRDGGPRARPRLNRAVAMFWGARLDDGLQFQLVSRQQAAANDRSSLRIQAAFVVVTQLPRGNV